MEAIDKNEYISKLEVVRILQKAYAEGRIKAKDGLSSVLDDIQKADVKRGKWIYKGRVNGWDEMACSSCNATFSTQDREQIFDWNFCRKCGADMREHEPVKG